MNYLKATSLSEALDGLGSAGSPRILAGGTDLLVEHNRQPLAADTTFVYIGDIGELKQIHDRGDTLEVGSLATAAALEGSALVARKAPALMMAARESAGPQVRNRATIGGNIATASPAGDLVCALYALDATVVVAGPGGRNEKAMGELITGVKRTSLQKGELIESICIPTFEGTTGSAFCKMGSRKAMTISVANAACRVRLEGDTIADIRLAVGAMAPTVLRMTDIEGSLTGKKAEEAAIREACKDAAALVAPITDGRSTEWYRREVAPVLLAKTVLLAVEIARKGGVAQ